MLATTNYGEDGRCEISCGCTCSIWQHSVHTYVSTVMCLAVVKPFLLDDAVLGTVGMYSTRNSVHLLNPNPYSTCALTNLNFRCRVFQLTPVLSCKGQFWKPRVCHDISMVWQVIAKGLGIFEWSAELARHQLGTNLHTCKHKCSTLIRGN